MNGVRVLFICGLTVMRTSDKLLLVKFSLRGGDTVKKMPLGKWLNLWATLLAALSVYEFCTRVDAMW